MLHFVELIFLYGLAEGNSRETERHNFETITLMPIKDYVEHESFWLSLVWDIIMIVSVVLFEIEIFLSM